MTKLLLMLAVAFSLGCVSGCGDAPPMKPGGGGHMQPYSPANGQYIPPSK